MPKRIPIAAAKNLAGEYDCPQVIIMAWDGERTHCVTYGKTIKDCDEAAQGGDRIKSALGWPESLMAVPSRVNKIKARIAELEHLVDCAESIICNAVPMSHCTQAEWDSIVKNWRDKKHGVP